VLKSLEGKVAVVAGATRGAGRGIARELGAAGAIVYATGRSTRAQRSVLNRPETIEETAELVDAAGGTGIPVRVDHQVEGEVRELFERVAKEQNGQLDVLVNDLWGGENLVEFDIPFWDHSLENGLEMIRNSIMGHIITSYYGAPMMVALKRGLIIEITDGDAWFNREYRGNLYYDFVKVGAIRLALEQAGDLRPHNVAAVSLSPGFLRSEEMLEHFGVTEENWRDGALKDPHFIASETPTYVGRAVVALASDPNIMDKSGKSFATWSLVHEYGFTDADGSQPDFGAYYKREVLDSP
jgi:NAD(P)-dependent dehydrogenase (short-subunit alcohol dehydrogenase family)